MTSDPDAIAAYETEAELHWEPVFSDAWGDAPWEIMLGIRPTHIAFFDLYDEAVRFDAMALLESIQRAGAFDVVNCSCGYSGDIGLEGVIHIAHPDADHIVWEIDRRSSEGIVQSALQGDAGLVRLIFERDTYTAQVRGMLVLLEEWIRQPRSLRQLRDYDANFAADSCLAPDTCFAVCALEPAVDGREIERLAAMLARQ